MSLTITETAIKRVSQSRFLRTCLGRPYLSINKLMWGYLPRVVTSWRPVRAYGVHLHRLIQLRAARTQSVGTFFFRNRPELRLLVRLLDQNSPGSAVRIAILGCSKGAEVYSISYALRSARPDLDIWICALDIAADVLRFAEGGAYSLANRDGFGAPGSSSAALNGVVTTITLRDQNRSIFERVSSEEMQAMFDLEDAHVRVKPRFRGGITWHVGDAGNPVLLNELGLQDIVVANRFLCHMSPDHAERCLRNLARLVRPGGYLLVSGVDLDVRSNVARDLGWKPVTDSIREVHEGDPSLRRDWPLRHWGLEPFDQRRTDWQFRYASVFQL